MCVSVRPVKPADPAMENTGTLLPPETQELRARQEELEECPRSLCVVSSSYLVMQS